MRKLVLPLLLLFFITESRAQTGGTAVFPYITLSPSARVSALGGQLISIKDDDVSLFVQNPAMLSRDMNNKISLSYQPYTGKINNSFAAYSHTFGKDWSFGAAVQFINYGKFLQTDEIGNQIGNFFANDYAITMGLSRPLNARISYGANVKFLYSVLSSYSSSAIAADFGGTYSDTAHAFTLSAVISNLGTQLKSYTAVEDKKKEKLPLDLQIGVTKRLKHTPFQFTVGLHHLQKYDIRYNDTNAVSNNVLALDSASQDTKPKKYVADKLARHVIVGLEIIIGKNLRLQVGYNHLRRQELGFDARKGLAGFNVGGQVKINRFTIGYAHSFFNIAGGYNAISLGLDIDDFIGKRKL